MTNNELLVTSGFLASGAAAGHAARRLLARLRRGAVFRPPGCELFAAMASGIVGWRVAVGALPVWWCAVPLLLGWLAVPLAAVDLVALRLPNALTYAAYPILGTALAIASADGPDHVLAIRAMLGAATFGGAHALVRCLVPTALGAGDAKLAGSLGAVLGALGWPSLLTATALAATITLLLALTRRHNSAEATTADQARLAEPNQPPPDQPPTNPKPNPSIEPAINPELALPTKPNPPSASEPTNPQEAVRPAPKDCPRPHQPTETLPTNSQEALRPEPNQPPPAESPKPPPAESTSPRGESPESERAESPKEVPPTKPKVVEPDTGQGRIPLLRRAVPHGPGLLAATWLLATFPGQALIGGVTS